MSKKGKRRNARAAVRSVAAIMVHSCIWAMRYGMRSLTTKVAAEKLPRTQPMEDGVKSAAVQ